MRASILPIVVLFVIPVAANGLALLGVVDADSQVLFSGLQEHVVRGFLAGLPFIDPSVGFIYEPLAREALRQWLSREIPWWNHYEGVGFPLAGGVVAGAFSPYLPLLAVPKGIILQQVAAQLVCGLATYRALRLLDCSRFAAFVGGALFELNGSFAWLGSIWTMPIVALPLWVCGIESLRRPERRNTFFGIAYIIVATDLAIVASFIETGFIAGVFAASWAIVRFPWNSARGRLRYAAGCFAGGSIGIMLASPMLVAFGDALRYGLSTHSGNAFGFGSIPTEGVPQLFLPYVWGPIFRYAAGQLSALWGSVGGYAGLATVVVAGAVFAVRRFRPVFAFLAAWIIVTVGAEFGTPPMLQLFNLIPGISHTAQYRYSPPTWEFALALLCGLLLSEWQRGERLFLRPPHRIVLAVLAVVLTGFLYAHASDVDAILAQGGYAKWLFSSLALAAVLLGVLLAAMARPGPRSLRIIGGVLVGEAMLWYLIPTFAYPRSGQVATGYVAAFHQRAGYARLYSLNALQPNFGTFYQIPQLNYNDTIIPADFVDFLPKLDPFNALPIMFLTYRFHDPGNLPQLSAMLAWHLRSFEELGVGYVDATPSQLLPVFAPAVQPGREAQTLGRRALSGQFDDPIVGDRISGIRIPIDLEGDPDGIITARMCSREVCVIGTRSLGASEPPEQTLDVPFNRTLNVQGGPLSFVIAQRDYRRAASIWLNIRGSDDEHVADAPGLFPPIAVTTQLMSFVVPMGAALPGRSIDLAPKPLVATIEPPQVNGSVVAVGIPQGGDGVAETSLQAVVCSGGGCESGRREVAANAPGPVDIQLARPLALSDAPLRITLSEIGSHHADPAQLYSEVPAFRENLIAADRPQEGVAIPLRIVVAMEPPTEVYHHGSVSLFELPGALPYFDAPDCEIRAVSRDALTAQCAHQVTLVRRELFYSGWTATVNGAPAQIGRHDEILQEVALPAGRSVVRFSYQPRYARLALGLALIALGCFGLTVVGGWLNRDPQAALASP